jgi:hypothetical protein
MNKPSDLFVKKFAHLSERDQRLILIDLLDSYAERHAACPNAEYVTSGLLHALDMVWKDDQEYYSDLINAVAEEEEYFSYYDI